MIIDLTQTKIGYTIQRRFYDSLSTFEWNQLPDSEQRWCFVNYGPLYRIGDDDHPQYCLAAGKR